MPTWAETKNWIRSVCSFWGLCFWMAGKRALGFSLGIGTALGLIGVLVFPPEQAWIVSYAVAWIAVCSFVLLFVYVLFTSPVRLYEQQKRDIEKLRGPDEAAKRKAARERLGALLAQGLAIKRALWKDHPGALESFHAFLLQADEALRTELDSSYVVRFHSTVGLPSIAVPLRMSRKPKEQRTAWLDVSGMVERLHEFLRELA